MAVLRIAGTLLLVLSLAAFIHGGPGLSAMATVPGEPLGSGLAAGAVGAEADAGFRAIPQWVSLAAMVVAGVVLILGWRSRN